MKMYKIIVGFKLEVEAESIDEACEKYNRFASKIPSALFPLNKEGIVSREPFFEIAEEE